MANKLVKVEGRTISVPSDATPDEIDEIFKSQAPAPQQAASAPAAHDIQAAPKPFTKAWFKQGAYNLADKATNALPGAGGIIGGVLGGAGGTAIEPGGGSLVGAVGGAGIGGMTGEAAKNAIRAKVFPKEPQMTLPQTMNDITKQGLVQGANELAGQTIGRVGKAIAPGIAEVAVAPGKRLLKSVPEGVDIGKTVLNETSGYNPKAITAELDSKIAADRAAKVAAMQQATKSGVQIPIAKPQAIVADELAPALRRNNPEYLRDVNGLNDQMNYQMGADGKPELTRVAGPKTKVGQVPLAPKPLTPLMDPERYDALRQGVDMTIGNFNPESQSAIAPTARMVRGTMARDLHAAVPDTAIPDARMTQMIPARDAAWNVGYNPSISRQVAEKLVRPTGALFGGYAGYKEGEKYGGPVGGLAGGALGLVGGNFLASPEGAMGIARFADQGAPVVGRIVRAAAPAIESQVGKKPKSYDPEEGEPTE